MDNKIIGSRIEEIKLTDDGHTEILLDNNCVIQFTDNAGVEVPVWWFEDE